MIYSFKEKAKKAIKLVKEESLIIYLILYLFIAYIFVAYIDWYIDWHNENVVSILSQFKSNIWMQLLTGVLIVIAVYDLKSKYQLRYQYDWKVILPLFLVSILLAYYRLFTERYNYIYWICPVSYVDVIYSFGFLYSIAASVNYYRMYRSKCERNNSTCEILSDYPIEAKEEDIFSFDNDANKLADKINGLDRKKTWSIAITAPWGTGKTSFMNLVIENINENEFEIVRFNPRDCKSFKTIQEDFFTAIACVLSKYDSRCSNTIKDYMASLQLIDNRGIIEKLTSFYQIWNKVELKESIEKSFASLNKRVLVMIDDFDRLSKDEILEVLKLIDSNAAFTNLIFLTAYDKKQVNRMLGDDYETKDACFVDKFFNLEFAIPLRSYTYISRYINEKLCELLKADSSETDKIHRTIKYWQTTFEKFLPTLRDAKRYINQFLLDFQGVRGDVVVNEFLLVQLIKYRYPEQYRSLYKKEYITEGVGSDNNNLYINKNNVNKELNIYPILKRLFPDSPTRNSYGTPENHIFHTQSFVYYFENQISGSLRVADIKNLFSLPWNEVTNTIDGWITNNESYDFIDYLNRLYRSKFNNEEFLRYAEMVTYIAYKEPKSDAYELFTKIIYIEYLKANNIKTKSERTNYKKRLFEIIERNAPQLFTRIHLDYKTLRKNEDEYIIKDNDIWPLIKEKFIQTTKDDSADDDNLINWLHRCIDNMEETTRKIFLDKDCLEAYRQRVEKNPDYYIKTFVRLGMITSSPDWNTIACEPFWEQIFEDENKFENFLLECKNKKIEKSELAWNFWLLYKANNYKPIEFENQGNVQEKIDNKLAREVQELKKMQNIETNVSLIPDSISDEGERITNKKLLSQYKKELDDITLNISLNGKIRKAIDDKLKNLSIFE